MPVSLRGGIDTVKRAKPGFSLGMINIDLYVYNPNILSQQYLLCCCCAAEWIARANPVVFTHTESEMSSSSTLSSDGHAVPTGN